MTSPTFDAVVAGGGAAGLFAAVTAARRGLSVLIAEPNEIPGRKLRITGKGRCNVTNDCAVGEFLRNVASGEKFLKSALYGFPPSAAVDFFEKLGVPLKTERGRRVFPQSDDANDIADALAGECVRLGVATSRAKLTDVKTADGRIASVTAGGEKVPCRSVILATGGLSYPKTGSTGDGYRLATALGHTVTATSASLVPLVSPDADCGEMQGLSLKNVRLRVYGAEGKPVFDDFGEALFTHFGLSGPLVLSASAHMRSFPYRAVFDLKPAIPDGELDARLVRELAGSANRDFRNALGGLLPRLMIPIFVRRSGIDPYKKCNSVTRAERLRTAALLRAFEVEISGTRPVDEAIITRGGVSAAEVNPRTMESKLVPGLHFAGEILDCDAYTGGYNLQIAWSTAFAAGNGVCADGTNQE
ncbi:MAG: NAD(P)/FAD-dependent oxidoreductase [Oscillospiraceae bacterium]|jgi:predicted Rossmann fold flavoprotein|nr:NAD(P)/FAD-dependent oxidoreductase [Oscillospiraceae bacterium]